MGFLGGLFQSFNNSFNAGVYAAKRVYQDPSLSHQEELYTQHFSQFMLLWAYYEGSIFDKVARFMNSGAWQNSLYWPASGGWQTYKSNYNLYRNIRLIYNPVRRLVNFYSGRIYPGVLSKDGEALPDGVACAIPFTKDTDPAMKAVVAQLWQWSNFQEQKSVFVRYGAALGSVMIEVIDDVENGEVYTEIQWPGFVRDLKLDPKGNVKSYSLQYAVWTQDEGSYYYRKDVDKDQIAYYKNDEPFDYGFGAVIDNPYNFVPAVWIKHESSGATYGNPAIHGTLGKVDELNNLASHTHDQIHKIIGAPVVFWSDSPIGNLTASKNNQTRGQTYEFEKPMQEQENILLLKGGAGGRVDSLVGSLSLGDARSYMLDLVGEIEKDHPELTYFEQLRQMSQVTGPAAERLVGDVSNRVIEAQANYDQALVRLFQMAAMIGGMRANSGAWGSLNSQQQKFKPFNLDSYQKGNLDLTIAPRVFLPPTKSEIANENQAMWLGVQAAVTAGAPLEVVLANEGWTEDQLAELEEKQVKSIQNKQLLAQQDVIPEQGQ